MPNKLEGLVNLTGNVNNKHLFFRKKDSSSWGSVSDLDHSLY